MGYPSFNTGDVLAAADMNAVGLWKITSGSLTSTGIAVDNVFSANFDQYLVRIVALNGGTAGADSSWDILFRTSGIDNTGSNYRYQNSYFSTTGVFARQTTATTKAVLQPSSGAVNYCFDIRVFNPFSNTQNTFYDMTGHIEGTVTCNAAGHFNANTRFDGIKVRFNGTSIGGTYYVYGYRN